MKTFFKMLYIAFTLILIHVNISQGQATIGAAPSNPASIGGSTGLVFTAQDTAKHIPPNADNQTILEKIVGETQKKIFDILFALIGIILAVVAILSNINHFQKLLASRFIKYLRKPTLRSAIKTYISLAAIFFFFDIVFVAKPGAFLWFKAHPFMMDFATIIVLMVLGLFIYLVARIISLVCEK
jgi:hypothetical protein